ncbi:MAG TPA: translesion DNA synthesis-associated protein ImuA [Ramlibacter sp.]|nr:translesion DNA synthesis-associated protein ImuA [Ramlibacter sp.]
MTTRPAFLLPAELPHVWRAEEIGQEQAQTLATGHPLLDAQLPGGGWPIGSLVELLQAQPERHVWQLLLPGLGQMVQNQCGPVVLVGAPYAPFGPSLTAQALPGERLLWVKAEQASARLWAAEQALRCADVVAVLAWLPQVRSTELHRLHMAAQQHSKLLFVFRGLRARHEASPAHLRLLLEGTQEMQVQILKRRGPPLLAALSLPAHPVRLAALLEAREGRPVPAEPASSPERSHGLDRTAAHA